MKKFIVETYYTCTFKTVHKLDELNDQELAKIDGRSDGEVEVIEVKLNNRKTKKVGDKSQSKNKKNENSGPTSDIIADKVINSKNININDVSLNNKIKGEVSSRYKMPDREKDTFKKLKLEIIKFIYILASTLTAKLEKFLLILIKKESL